MDMRETKKVMETHGMLALPVTETEHRRKSRFGTSVGEGQWRTVSMASSSRCWVWVPLRHTSEVPG